MSAVRLTRVYHANKEIEFSLRYNIVFKLIFNVLKSYFVIGVMTFDFIYPCYIFFVAYNFLKFPRQHSL